MTKNNISGLEIDPDVYYDKHGICVNKYESSFTIGNRDEVIHKLCEKGTSIKYAVINADNHIVYDIESIGIIYEHTFHKHFINDKSVKRLEKIDSLLK